MMKLWLYVFDNETVIKLNFKESSLSGIWGGEAAQWLAPRICYANREVCGSNLTVSTDDPVIHCGERRWRSAKGASLCSPRFNQPNVQEIVHEG